MILPDNIGPVEDRMAIVALDSNDHDDWNDVLPTAMPLFIHYDDEMNPLVRWSMPREDAERLGFWGATCPCCGLGAPQDDDVWEFDTKYEQTSWYTDALGAVT